MVRRATGNSQILRWMKPQRDGSNDDIIFTATSLSAQSAETNPTGLPEEDMRDVSESGAVAKTSRTVVSPPTKSSRLAVSQHPAPTTPMRAKPAVVAASARAHDLASSPVTTGTQRSIASPSAMASSSPSHVFKSSPNTIVVRPVQKQLNEYLPRTPSSTRSASTSMSEEIATPCSFHSAASRLDSLDTSVPMVPSPVKPEGHLHSSPSAGVAVLKAATHSSPSKPTGSPSFLSSPHLEAAVQQGTHSSVVVDLNEMDDVICASNRIQTTAPVDVTTASSDEDEDEPITPADGIVAILGETQIMQTVDAVDITITATDETINAQATTEKTGISLVEMEIDATEAMEVDAAEITNGTLDAIQPGVAEYSMREDLENNVSGSKRAGKESGSQRLSSQVRVPLSDILSPSKVSKVEIRGAKISAKPKPSSHDLLDSFLGLRKRTTRSTTSRDQFKTPTSKSAVEIPKSLLLLQSQAKENQRLLDIMATADRYASGTAVEENDGVKVSKSTVSIVGKDLDDAGLDLLMAGLHEAEKKKIMFYYFDLTMRSDAERLEFPDIPNGWWRDCLGDPNTRDEMFLSGFVRDMVDSGNRIPESLVRWIALGASREPNSFLVQAYYQVLILCDDAELDEELLDLFYYGLGVKEEFFAEDSRLTLSYDMASKKHSRFRIHNIKSVMDYMTYVLAKQEFKRPVFRNVFWFCVGSLLDEDVGKLLYLPICNLFHVLLDSVPAESWSEEAYYIFETIFGKVRDSSQRVALLERLPINPGARAMQVRTNLALSFFLDDVRFVLTLDRDRVPVSQKILPELHQNSLYRLKVEERPGTPTPSSALAVVSSDAEDEDMLTDGSSDEEEAVAKAKVEFDYVLLKDRIRCLDYALMTTLRIDKNLDDIRAVIEFLRKLNRRIYDPQARFPDRTDAKTAIQACEYRLSYMIVGSGVRQSVMERHFLA